MNIACAVEEGKEGCQSVSRLVQVEASTTGTGQDSSGMYSAPLSLP